MHRATRVYHFQATTVKLGLNIHGLVRTLGYNVLSVYHGHRQLENKYIFLDKTYRTWHKIGKPHTNFPSKSTFLPFQRFFFSDHEHAIQPFNFDFNFLARFQVHDVLKGDFIERKASNERHSGWRSIFHGRSFGWTRGTGPAREENRVLDRTYFG